MAGISSNSALEDEEMTWEEACALIDKQDLDNVPIQIGAEIHMPHVKELAPGETVAVLPLKHWKMHTKISLDFMKGGLTEAAGAVKAVKSVAERAIEQNNSYKMEVEEKKSREEKATEHEAQKQDEEVTPSEAELAKVTAELQAMTEDTDAYFCESNHSVIKRGIHPKRVVLNQFIGSVEILDFGDHQIPIPHAPVPSAQNWLTASWIRHLQTHRETETAIVTLLNSRLQRVAKRNYNLAKIYCIGLQQKKESYACSCYKIILDHMDKQRWIAELRFDFGWDFNLIGIIEQQMIRYVMFTCKLRFIYREEQYHDVFFDMYFTTS